MSDRGIRILMWLCFSAAAIMALLMTASVAVGQPPRFEVTNKVPPAFTVVNRIVPKKPTYASILARVQAGETITVKFPDDVSDPPDGIVGTWRCFPQNGKPMMEQVGVPASRPFPEGLGSTLPTNALPVGPASMSFPGSTQMGRTITNVLPAGRFGDTNCAPSG